MNPHTVLKFFFSFVDTNEMASLELRKVVGGIYIGKTQTTIKKKKKKSSNKM